MLNKDVLKRILGDVALPTHMNVRDAIDDGYLFAVRLNEQRREATLYYINGNQAKGEELVVPLSFEQTANLSRAVSIKSPGDTHNEYITCGDVHIRAGMVSKFETLDDVVRVVPWGDSHRTYFNDINFTLLGGRATITIPRIEDGVARPFTDAGFHVIPRGIRKPYFEVRKAEGDQAPLLLHDPRRAPQGHERIRTGSGLDVPRQYHCV